MTLARVRWLVDAAIVLLVATNVIQWIAGIWEYALGLIISLIYLLCYRKARERVDPDPAYYVWMWLPTALFVVIPVVWRLFLTSDEVTLIERIWLALPLFSVIVPVVLLLLARTALQATIRNAG